jgi:alpha-N-arabinofuranosidase
MRQRSIQLRQGARRAPLLALLGLVASGANLPQSTPAAATATVEIDAASVENRISPLLYGQFIEFMYEGIKGGLHAELIRNRGFDSSASAEASADTSPAKATGDKASVMPRYWERYPDDRIDDYGISFASERRAPDLARARFEGSFEGTALRIQLRPAVVSRHGLFQERVPVRRGIEYSGSIWIKTDGFDGQVRITLEADRTGGPVYADAPIPDVAGDWKRYTFTLRPSASDPLARFAILLAGQGTVWIDQVSLLPGDAVGEVRVDTFEKVKALRPSFIRYPGGNVAQDYHWQWGIGPRDERPAWINLSWNNEIEPSDFGTDEFVAFARAVGAEPSITVNVDGRGATVDEAAAWVEYCNGAATTKYGALRARNGHPEPYGVKYWEIGNEIWGDWVRGHSDAATYARNLNRYVAAMRAVDPSISVIAVGDNDMAWNRTVLRDSSERVDTLAIHHYYSRRDMDGDLRNLMARPLHYERFYGKVDAELHALPAERRPTLAINEWGLDLPEAQQYSILAGLYAARLMNVFERHGRLISMSAVSDLVNGWPGGIIQASRHGVFVTPIYLVNQLYATHLGAERLATRVDGPTFSSSREGTDIPVVDVVASRSADGGSIFIKAVNTDLERPVTTNVTVRGARVSPNAVVERVVADSSAAVNGFATPNAVRQTRDPLKAGESVSLVLPPHSVSIVTLAIAK